MNSLLGRSDYRSRIIVAIGGGANPGAAPQLRALLSFLGTFT
jgi:hypothetical protein